MEMVWTLMTTQPKHSEPSTGAVNIK
uniref:Uncharacterized protein n=1 Tax=Anguilla anguilla TaxID=7936 RepID=A0A0E9VFD1_ANGAN